MESGRSELRRKRPRDETNTVQWHRLEHGMCHSCGNHIYESKLEGGTRWFVSRNIPGVVRNGRCLYCYPDPPPERSASVAVVVSSAVPISSAATISATPPNKVIRHGKGPNGSKHDAENGNETCHPGDKVDSRPQLNDPMASTEISITDSDGLVFTGILPIESSRWKGTGFFTHTVGQGEHKGKLSTYEGEYEDGKFHGRGVSRDAHGSVYDGQFHRGGAHGKGTCTWAKGWVYEGDWRFDKRHGLGKSNQLEDSGQVYQGEWKNDCWNGTGTLQFAGGGTYTGCFQNDKLHGEGQYEFSDGSVYKGAFQNDFRVGHGCMDYHPGGLRYVGEWKKNWRHGIGTMFYTEGSIFKGTFRSDEKHGTGYLHLPDGIVRKQTWDEGTLVLVN